MDSYSKQNGQLGERNLIFSFTDSEGKILGRRREKNKKS
jgi:hypothetical protein